MKQLRGIVWRGLWTQNPALVQLLGLCPLLAVSNSTVNGLGLGMATLLALLVSSTAVSLLRTRIRADIRLPVYVLILATAVSMVDLMMEAWSPVLHARLGIFVPLIVTNCAVLARAEAYASRHGPLAASLDALAMGGGFAVVLVVLGGVRELAGHGTLLAGMQLLFGAGAADLEWRLGEGGLLLAVLPPGAFLALAAVAALRAPPAARSAVQVDAPRLPGAGGER